MALMQSARRPGRLWVMMSAAFAFFTRGPHPQPKPVPRLVGETHTDGLVFTDKDAPVNIVPLTSPTGEVAAGMDGGPVPALKLDQGGIVGSLVTYRTHGVNLVHHAQGDLNAISNHAISIA